MSNSCSSLCKVGYDEQQLQQKYALINIIIIYQDSLFNAYCTVINEGPAIKVLYLYVKLPFELRNSRGSHAGSN